MKIELRPSFSVLLGILIALDPAGLLPPFLLAAAIHEAGHLLCMKLCGAEAYAITVGFAGAVIRTASMSRRQELLSAAAGPAVNLLSGILFFRVFPVFSLLSLLLGLFNLLPMFPLDGGRILSCLAPKAAPLIGAAAAAVLFIGGMLACAVLHRGLWPLILPAVLLAKVAVCCRQEQKLIAKNGFAVYNIQ